MFFTSGILILAFVAAGIGVSQAMGSEDASALAWDWLIAISDTMGWFYVLATAFFLVFVIWLMFSRYGKVKLGADDSKPEFGTIAWFAMLFTAGMGIGLVFWGTAEPTGYVTNGVVVGLSDNPDAQNPALQAREAMDPSLFHWGFQPWAIYIVLGLALAYFSYRKGLPMRPAAAFYPLIGNRIYGGLGYLIDILAVLGTMFGLATSLGIGTQQINAGLARLSDAIPAESVAVQVGIIGVITLVALVSVLVGIDKGVRRLSIVNLWMAAALLVFVFIAGPTAFIISGMFDWTGTYLSNLVNNSLTVANPETAEDHAAWQSAWTFFYWGWWISWAPFVGMFIARISRGRTIRQFVVGTLFAPVGVSIAWFSTLGGSGLYYDIPLVNDLTQELGVDGFHEAVDDGEAGTIGAGGEGDALFRMLEFLPIASSVVWLATLLTILVVAIFFITSSDSGSLVIDMLTNGGDRNPVPYQRAFWALLEGIVTAVILVGGGTGALMILRATSVTTGLPFAVVLIFVAIGLARALREENLAALQAREMGIPAPTLSQYGGSPSQEGSGPEPSTAVNVSSSSEDTTEEQSNRGTGGE
ncbi:BCCT family transporter [Lipingzhangella sp. LS1_29]|uniref:BCCT family transporter n=1 Tax=Lipingzhangella rawalii TaxID=2055835 RepID=A0ABU2H6U4_9ACTN|nr:BCCT family transporter [Lipingzhangella rawalii]MDS1271011.1 BCCT family transporter [Lipingzhangella rawalii]